MELTPSMIAGFSFPRLFGDNDIIDVAIQPANRDGADSADVVDGSDEPDELEEYASFVISSDPANSSKHEEINDVYVAVRSDDESPEIGSESGNESDDEADDEAGYTSTSETNTTCASQDEHQSSPECRAKPADDLIADEILRYPETENILARLSGRNNRWADLADYSDDTDLKTVGWMPSNYRDVVWWKNYTLLREYATALNALPVAFRFDYKGFHIGTWITRQKKMKLDGKLAREKRKLLKMLPGWTWSSHTLCPLKYWEGLLIRLRGFLAVYRHYPTKAENYRLYGWVKAHRELMYAMPNSRRVILENMGKEVGVPWEWFDDNRWKHHVGKLAEFVGVHGSIPVDTAVDPGAKTMVAWIEYQKNRLVQGIMKPEELRELNNLCAWQDDEFQWMSIYASARRMMKANRKIPCFNSKSNSTAEYIVMGNWVWRQLYSKLWSRISQSRVELLESIPGWDWNYGRLYWTDMFTALIMYMSIYSRVPGEDVIFCGKAIGAWVQNEATQLAPDSPMYSSIQLLAALINR